jgi:hypothetical protein
MQIRLRRAKPEDISRARKLLEPDRPLFQPDTWASLPKLLEDLLDRERILLCLLEDMDAGRIVFIGGSGFVTPDFLNQAIENGVGLVAPAFHAELRVRTTFPKPQARGSKAIHVVIPQLTTIVGLVFDSRHRLYILEMSAGTGGPAPGQGQILRYEYNGTLTTIATGLSFSTAMTFGPDGYLYVSNQGFGFPPGAGQIVTVSVPN